MRQDVNQAKDWSWKIGGGNRQASEVSSEISYRFIVNLCIKYFSANNQIYALYIEVDLVVLELKREIPLSH